MEDRRGPQHSLHGYQVWVALPKAQEEMAPRFDFISHDDLPKWQEDHLQIKLIAGTAYGRKSPLPVYSPLFMIDAFAEEDSWLEIKGQLEGEIAIVVTSGEVINEHERIEAGQMLISKTENECAVQLEKGTRLLIFGGQPFPEERFLHWNFVSSSKERLAQAKMDWQNHRFPKVPGDDTYIPIPG